MSEFNAAAVVSELPATTVESLPKTDNSEALWNKALESEIVTGDKSGLIASTVAECRAKSGADEQFLPFKILAYFKEYGSILSDEPKVIAAEIRKLGRQAGIDYGFEETVDEKSDEVVRALEKETIEALKSDSLKEWTDKVLTLEDGRVARTDDSIEALFPKISDEVRNGLDRSIRARGVDHPITLGIMDGCPVILDGSHLPEIIANVWATQGKIADNAREIVPLFRWAYQDHKTVDNDSPSMNDCLADEKHELLDIATRLVLARRNLSDYEQKSAIENRLRLDAADRRFRVASWLAEEFGVPVSRVRYIRNQLELFDSIEVPRFYLKRPDPITGVSEPVWNPNYQERLERIERHKRDAAKEAERLAQKKAEADERKQKAKEAKKAKKADPVVNAPAPAPKPPEPTNTPDSVVNPVEPATPATPAPEVTGTPPEVARAIRVDNLEVDEQEPDEAVIDFDFAKVVDQHDFSNVAAFQSLDKFLEAIRELDGFEVGDFANCLDQLVNVVKSKTVVKRGQLEMKPVEAVRPEPQEPPKVDRRRRNQTATMA